MSIKMPDDDIDDTTKTTLNNLEDNDAPDFRTPN